MDGCLQEYLPVLKAALSAANLFSKDYRDPSGLSSQAGAIPGPNYAIIPIRASYNSIDRMERWMSRTVLVSLSLFMIFSAIWIPGAAHQPELGSESSGPTALCLPGVYSAEPGDCLPAGPSAYMTQIAEKGILLPIPPLPDLPTDPALAQIDVRYAEVISDNAPIYGSIDDAVAGKRKQAVGTLKGLTVYISYTQEDEVNGKRIYTIAPGQYMRGADISRIGAFPRFQGVAFSRTPDTAFGWVLTYFAPGPLETKRTPGDQVSDFTGHVLDLYQIVPVFTEEVVGNATWYMVAPDEWVPAKYIARVTPTTSPPSGVTGERWIEVNLFEQTLAVYDQGELVFATVIASGVDPFWTRPGLFQIREKLDKTPMTGSFEADRSDAYYLEDVPWTMYYDDARALHGAYWRAKMGFPQSHGCLNMTMGDAHWLYDWAQVGDWVYVWDPSGLTPTDPGLYGPGGY
jgi:hypothetical protein